MSRARSLQVRRLAACAATATLLRATAAFITAAATAAPDPDAASPPAVSGTATATVIRAVATGIRHPQGNVRMSLFAGPEGFPEKPEQGVEWQQVAVTGDSAVVVFAPVPPGQYAVAAFHDENGDGALRRDWLGRPKEGWGVSRDAKARFGPPHFEQSAFMATPDTCTVRLRMRY